MKKNGTISWVGIFFPHSKCVCAALALEQEIPSYSQSHGIQKNTYDDDKDRASKTWQKQIFPMWQEINMKRETRESKNNVRQNKIYTMEWKWKKRHTIKHFYLCFSR